MNAATPLHPIRAWNAFWFGRVSARPLGAFRIVFGIVTLLHLALLWPDANLWLSDQGYLRGTEAAELAGPMRWSPLQIWQSPVLVQGVMAATSGVALLYALGWHTRLMGVLLYAGLLSIHHRNLLTTSGADVLLMIVAFWMMLSPAGRAFSLDHRRKCRRAGASFEELISPWPQRMIQIQVALAYLNTGLLKAQGASWQNGTALFYVLGNREITRWTFGLMDQIEIINALTYTSLTLELALAFLLWFRMARPWIIPCGLALHGGIMLTVNIPIFGELICASYLLFLTPDELNWITRRVNPLRWGRAASSDEPLNSPKAASSAPDRWTRIDRASALRFGTGSSVTRTPVARKARPDELLSESTPLRSRESREQPR